MPGREFYIVDVFAEKKYAGNQLAVVRDAADLSVTEMQLIAREMNFKETSFILSDRPNQGGYDVRIFTPVGEIPFAGHPALGTACIIRHEIMERPSDEVILNLKVGAISVSFGDVSGMAGYVWMKQHAPVFGREFDRKTLATALGIADGDVDERFPAREVSTGTPFIIVPLKSLAAVEKARIVPEIFEAIIEKAEAKAILLFTTETVDSDNDLHARVFADYYGVPEDPATGSANGCLAGYMIEHRFLGRDTVDLRVEQGLEIGRPSLIFLKAYKEDQRIEIYVGGRVYMVARGEMV